jgi:hypothetical protein
MKQKSAVEWLESQLTEYLQRMYKFEIDQAKEMENQKQQKYKEMLEMLKSCVLVFDQLGMKEPTGVTELIKSATEL